MAICNYGLLGVSIASNVLLLYLALDSYRPLVESNPYEKGLNYQAVVDQELNFLRSKWKIDFDLINTDSNASVLEAKVLDSKNALVKNLKVSVVAIRPNASSKDRKIDLLESQQSYRASMDPLEKGLWLITFLLESDGKDLRHQVKFLAP